MSDVVCPLCGEGDFDAPGFVGHIDRWCEKAAVARDALSEILRREYETALRHREQSLSLPRKSA